MARAAEAFSHRRRWLRRRSAASPRNRRKPRSGESRAAAKAGAFVQPDRRELPVAGFQPQHGLAGGDRLCLDLRQQPPRHTSPPYGLADEHALDLGEIVEQRNPAAAHRLAVQARQKQNDMRPEQRIEVEAVALVGGIGSSERPVEGADQVPHRVGRRQGPFDR
jgi:hypothetical protein